MSGKGTLLIPKDVAHILQCSPEDVIELARQGILRVAAPGTLWRFRQADVLEYKEKVGQNLFSGK